MPIPLLLLVTFRVFKKSSPNGKVSWKSLLISIQPCHILLLKIPLNRDQFKS